MHPFWLQFAPTVRKVVRSGRMVVEGLARGQAGVRNRPSIASQGIRLYPLLDGSGPSDTCFEYLLSLGVSLLKSFAIPDESGLVQRAGFSAGGVNSGASQCNR